MRAYFLIEMTAVAWLLAGCSDDDPTAGAMTGALEVATVTAGEALDTDGYSIAVGADTEYGIDVNDLLSLPGLPSGPHELLLAGVAPNCAVSGSNPRTVRVVAGDVTRTTFDVTCEAGPLPDLPGMIAFHSDRDGTFAVYLLDPAGGGSQRRLTTDASGPAISPDGSRILFMRTHDGNSEIYVMNADGSGQTRLTRDPATDERPSWSPDGTKILFTSDRDSSGGTDVFVMNTDGSGVVNLTNQTGTDRPAHWSPDGSRIAFSSNRAGAFDIYVMEADGADPVQVTNTPTAADFAPAWSPDGTRIAFTRNDNPPSDRGDIWIIDANGSAPVNLTSAPDLDNRWPSWSPDGSRILFTSRRTGNYELFVMNADGSEITNILRAPGSMEIPGWPQGWGARGSQ